MHVPVFEKFMFETRRRNKIEKTNKYVGKKTFNLSLRDYLIQEMVQSYLYVRRRVRDSLEHVFWELQKIK